MFYLPSKQDRLLLGLGPPNPVLIARGAADSAVTMASVRTAVRDLDPEIAISSILLTETALAGSIQRPWFNMALLAASAPLPTMPVGPPSLGSALLQTQFWPFASRPTGLPQA